MIKIVLESLNLFLFHRSVEMFFVLQFGFKSPRFKFGFHFVQSEDPPLFFDILPTVCKNQIDFSTEPLSYKII